MIRCVLLYLSTLMMIHAVILCKRVLNNKAKWLHDHHITYNETSEKGRSNINPCPIVIGSAWSSYTCPVFLIASYLSRVANDGVYSWGGSTSLKLGGQKFGANKPAYVLKPLTQDHTHFFRDQKHSVHRTHTPRCLGTWTFLAFQNSIWVSILCIHKNMYLLYTCHNA